MMNQRWLALIIIGVTMHTNTQDVIHQQQLNQYLQNALQAKQFKEAAQLLHLGADPAVGKDIAVDQMVNNDNAVELLMAHGAVFNSVNIAPGSEENWMNLAETLDYIIETDVRRVDPKRLSLYEVSQDPENIPTKVTVLDASLLSLDEINAYTKIALGQGGMQTATYLMSLDRVPDLMRGENVLHAIMLRELERVSHRAQLAQFIRWLQNNYNIIGDILYNASQYIQKSELAPAVLTNIMEEHLYWMARFNDTDSNSFLHYLARAPYLVSFVPQMAHEIMEVGSVSWRNGNNVTPIMIANAAGNTAFIRMFEMYNILTNVPIDTVSLALSQEFNLSQNIAQNAINRYVQTAQVTEDGDDYVPFHVRWKIVDYLYKNYPDIFMSTAAA